MGRCVQLSSREVSDLCMLEANYKQEQGNVSQKLYGLRALALGQNRLLHLSSQLKENLLSLLHD